MISATLLAAVVALGAGPAQAAKRSPRHVPPSFVGIVSQTDLTQGDFRRMSRGRVGWYRATVFWSKVQTGPHAFTWQHYDRLVTSAARSHVSLLLTLTGPTPAFLIPPGHGLYYPPTDSTALPAWKGFIRAAMHRYGRRGSFWRTHRRLPYRPVTAWEVWNEEDVSFFWEGADASTYAPFLRTSYRTMKAIDRRTTILIGGLVSRPDTSFVQALYAQPGIRRYFDAVDVHPYPFFTSVVGDIDQIRAVMNAHGDRKKPIWVGEIGWATGGGPYYSIVTSRAGQAARLRQLYTYLYAHRATMRVQRVFWFSWADTPPNNTGQDPWVPYAGLFDVHGRPKPSWRAMTQLTGGRP